MTDNYKKPKLIISTCGTSVLTNHWRADKDATDFIRDTANWTDIQFNKNKENKKRIDKIINDAENALINADITDARKLSAEINGIIGIYGGRITDENRKDQHYLITSDTYQGVKTAEILEKWLEKNGFKVVIKKTIKDLAAGDVQSAQLGLKELAKWCYEEIAERTDSHRIFNLTGGFKIILGFTTVLAMIYGDESSYLFEAKDSPVIGIPSLPIKLDDSQIENNLITFRKLAILGELPSDEVKGISDIYFMEINEKVTLSPIGQVIWDKVKRELYGKNVMIPPISSVEFSNDLRNSNYLSTRETEKIREFNERIDDLCLYMHDNSKNIQRLNFRTLEGRTGYSHEFNIRMKDKVRGFGNFAKEPRRFIIEKVDFGFNKE